MACGAVAHRLSHVASPQPGDGHYAKHNVFPTSGLSVARQLAMLLYKSVSLPLDFFCSLLASSNEFLAQWDDMNGRFEQRARQPYHFLSSDTFPIEQCEGAVVMRVCLTKGAQDLSHQGTKFQYDPNCYLLLSKCADLTNLQFRGATPLGTAGVMLLFAIGGQQR